MHTYEAKIRFEPDGVVIQALVSNLRKSAMVAPLSLFPQPELHIDKVGGIYCGDVLLRDQEEVEIAPGHTAYLDLKEIFDMVAEDPNRLPGKVCHDCTIWNRAEGKKQFSAQTHQYGNGSFSRIEEINNAVAAHNKAQPLTLEVIGYCPVHLKLCAESAVACKSYAPKPWVARVRNWWVRAFR